MTTYIGIPGTPAVVAATDDQGSHAISGDFGWGKADQRAADLALAILIVHFGQEGEARKYYRRFMWRAIVPLNAEKPWSLTSAEIETIIADMQTTEPDLARIRAQVSAEPVPVVREGGIGPGGAPVSDVEKRG